MLDRHRRALESNPWLSNLPKTVHERMSRSARISHYAPGQRVHSKNRKADGLYCVLSGELRITATNAAGREIVFTRLPAGNWFGEIAMLDGGLRTHDAHALIDSDIALIPKRHLLPIMENEPSVYRALVALLCQHCRQAFHALDDFLFSTPEQLLAKRLLDLAPKIGTRCTIKINQQELGNLIGISRQSVNRILGVWEERQLIKREYRGVTILSRKELEALSDQVLSQN